MNDCEVKMKLAVMMIVVVCAQALFGVVSPLQRFHAMMQQKYRGQFTRGVIDGFCDMEVVRDNSAKLAQEWYGAEALAWYRDFGNYALLTSLGKDRFGEAMRRVKSALDGRWMTYWNRLTQETRETLLRNPAQLEVFVSTVKRIRSDDVGDRNLDFLLRHPNALAYLDEYPELLSYSDVAVSAVVYSLEKLASEKTSESQRATVHSSMKNFELVSLLATDDALFRLYGEVPVLLFLTEPNLFQTSKDAQADLEVNRERLMIISSHLEYFVSRRKFSSNWDAEVDDYVKIFTYEPKRPELTKADWAQLLLSCRPESEKLMLLLRSYLHHPNGFETVERIAAAIIRDMKCYPPADLCVLLRLIRKGSMIHDFEALVRICLDTGLKTDPNSECQYPGVMLILSGVPEDPDFMDYLGKEKFGMRLIAYLGNYEYGKDIPERWGRAKLNKLEDAVYDESQAKMYINKIPCVGSLANVGVKMANGYPVTTAEYLCAGIDAVDIVLKVATMGSSSAGTEPAKEGVKKIAEETAKTAAKEAAKKKATEAAKEIAKKAAKSLVIKKKAKEYAKVAGQYIDEHREDLKDWAGKLAEIIRSLRGGDPGTRPSDESPFFQDPTELIAVFGRAFPLRQRTSASYVDRRGVVRQIVRPASALAWRREFDQNNNILLVSLVEG